MRKLLVLLVIMVFLALAVNLPAQTMIYPTYPGTSTRDYSQPGFKVEGNHVYPTYPGTTTRDYGQPGYIIVPNQGERSWPLADYPNYGTIHPR